MAILQNLATNNLEQTKRDDLRFSTFFLETSSKFRTKKQEFLSQF